MARPIKITSADVAEWERLQRDEHLDVREAAGRLGVSVQGLYDAQRRRDGAPGGPKPAKRAKGSKRASAGHRRSAPPARRGPPKRIAPAGDILAELTDLLALSKGQLMDLVGTKGYATVGALVDKIAARINAIQLSRRDAGGEGAAILARGAQAVAKIRQGRATLLAREVDTGCCAACGGQLGEEQLAERKARAA